MNRNYRTPKVADSWADSRETHMAIAVAIHAIADSKRSPEAIWDDPTVAEMDHIRMAVEEYLRHGDFDPTSSGRYSWGVEKLKITETPNGR